MMSPTQKGVFAKKKKSLNSYKNNIVLGMSYYKLFSSYDGYCVRVRRGSDNSEQNFGFVNNYIDINGIVDFCGGSIGYVSILYNQYVGGNNAIQATFGLQPIIYNGGFYTNGILFDGTSALRIVKYDAINITVIPLSIFINYRSTSDSNQGWIFMVNTNTSSNIQYGILKTSAELLSFYNAAGELINQSFTLNTQLKAQCNWISGATNGINLNVNGNYTTSTNNTSITSYANCYIGARSSAVDGSTFSNNFIGNVKTIVISNANMDYGTTKSF
jgi:hypothetical protein